MVDYLEAGCGPTVLLLHSSASGNHQWKNFINSSKDSFHFIALNLLGYGKTEKWKSEYPQKLIDQVRLLEKIPSLMDRNFSVIGHSFGGSVAMMAALHFEHAIDKLILIEPNPFYLLKTSGFSEAYQEALVLQKKIKKYYNNDWEKAVSFFSDYWNGKGSWEMYSDYQKERFSEILKPNFYEWDAVLNETTTIEDWYKKLPSNTTFISAQDTVFSIKEIRRLFMRHCKNWNFQTIKSGGHMAIIKKPDQLTQLLQKALL